MAAPQADIDVFPVRRTLVGSLAQAAIAWTTLAVVLFSAVFYGAVMPMTSTLLGLAVLPLFAAQGALVVARGGHWANRRLLVPGAAYLAALGWGLLQATPGLPADWAHPYWSLAPSAPATVSADPVAGGHIVLRLAIYAMVFWIAIQASMNARRAMTLLMAIGVFSSLLASFGLSAYITGENVVLGEQATGHLSATFVNRNSYALYAAFGLLVNLGVYLDLLRRGSETADDGRRMLRHLIERFFAGAWIFFLGAIICLAALILSGSRAGSASALIAALMLVASLQPGLARIRAVWITHAVLAVAFVAVVSGNLLGRLGDSGGGRLAIYREIVANLDGRLLLGHGLGAFQDTFREYVPPGAASANEWAVAHNAYLENLWEMGLPAALAFYGALAMLAAVVFQALTRRSRNRVFPCIAAACLVAGGLHSLFDFSLQLPATAALFAFVLGIGWAHAWRRRDL